MPRPQEAVTRRSYCRFCHNGCPILVEVHDGRPVRVTGDKSNDVYDGYTCVKGRALPEAHVGPNRLLRSLRRAPDGTYEPIESERALDEIAERLDELVQRHGPDAVATYTGTMAASAGPAVRPMVNAFMQALGSRMRFDTMSIDQIGKPIARALHGTWLAPPLDFDDPQVGLVVGANPFISYTGGLPSGHPGKWLKRWSDRGYQLIVIDPRRTDLAKRATIHLQARPGEDVGLLASMIRVILDEHLYDVEFARENVVGLDELRAGVAAIDPAEAARRADVPVDELVRAARVFADASRGVAVANTGPNMSGPGTLIEYLVLSLNTICGRWSRAGDRLTAPFTTLAGQPARAQAQGPTPAYDLGEPLPISGLRASAGGLPTAVLPGEILDGHRPIRSLISCGGNPVAAWPDQERAVQALNSLDLLVQIDVTMSATARLAHYVIAPRMTLETPSFTTTQQALNVTVGPGYGGHAVPWAQYTAAVVSPPEGSDLVEEWQFFYELARRLRLQLHLPRIIPWSGLSPVRIDMDKRPTTDDLLDLLAEGGRVPLDSVRAQPGGAVFDEPAVFVQPRLADCDDRLDVGNPLMMSDLAEWWRVEPERDDAEQPYPFRLISRRVQQVYNSSGLGLAPMRKRPYNPAFVHPDDLADLGLSAGDLVELTSATASILAVVEPDPTLRRRLVSMAHCFGGSEGGEDAARQSGSNTGRLLTASAGLQPYGGQPLMSNVPIAVGRPRS